MSVGAGPNLAGGLPVAPPGCMKGKCSIGPGGGAGNGPGFPDGGGGVPHRPPGIPDILPVPVVPPGMHGGPHRLLDKPTDPPPPPGCCKGPCPPDEPRPGSARYSFSIWWREFGPEPFRTPHIWWTITAHGVGLYYTLVIQVEGQPEEVFSDHVDADQTSDTGRHMAEEDALWRLEVQYDDAEPPDGEEGNLAPLR